jgi:microcystin-dependent protein
MAKRVQLIGYTAAGMATVAGLQRELFIDTTTWTISVQDGITLGGHELALASGANLPVAGPGNSGFMSAADYVTLHNGPITLDYGSASSPAFSFNGNTDTGMYYDPSTNSVAFTVDGQDLFYIPNGGAVAAKNGFIVPNQVHYYAQNVGGTADFNIGVVDSGNNIQLGDLSNGAATEVLGGSAVILGINNPAGGFYFEVGGQVVASMDTKGNFTAGTAVGQLGMFPTSILPSGWILCNGQAVSRTIFANLYSVIGGVFGAGDGSTTFNVPNYVGKVLACYGDGSLFPNAQYAGAAGGTITHTLSIAEMPNHDHATVDPSHTHVVNDPTHTHNYTIPVVTSGGGSGGNPSMGTGSTATSASYTGISNQTAVTGLQIQANGGSQPHSIVQPTSTVAVAIRA